VRRQQELERSIRAAVLGALPDTERRVREAVAEWNSVLREGLRLETGLKLRFENHKATVPVRLDDGLPPAFTEFLSRWEDPTDWVLELRRPQLEATLEGVQALAADREFLAARLGGYTSQSTVDAVESTASLIERLLAPSDRAVPEVGSIRVTDDYLGSYHFRSGEVRLFWVVLGAHASLLKLPVEALTVVVLAHELAHAYTHVGTDVDGRTWDTELISGTDRRILEGLAEYYCQVLCTGRYRAKLPELGTAYESLLAGSSGPYLVHKTWEQLGPKLGEAVRLAMLAARRRGIQDYDEFFRVLSGASRFMDPSAGAAPATGPTP
jgi:hypothetical protein